MIENISAKIQDKDEAEKLINGWHLKGDSIVFTNGCFDMLHYGHIDYLAKAKKLGNRLVVGLNSDDSVRRLKGNHRPINDLATRSHLLAALQFVDLVVIFEEDTPLGLIQQLRPDILVKGGDYQINQIVGADFVSANGGKVLNLPFVEGYSTTNIEQKIKNQ